MTGPLRNRCMGLVALLCVLALAALASWLNVRATPKAQHHPVDDYPELFVESAVCPRRGSVLASGRRSEELARLRSDRYAYDPRDGVRAVHHYLQAESCYRDEGNEHGAHRVRRAKAALTARVNTDYAAARLNPAAFSEIRRLLRLTDHIGRDEYVEWLRKNIGRVAARASVES